MKKSIEDRFWAKVNKHSGIFGVDSNMSTQCWEWTGALYPNGYGWFALGRRSEGTIGAHRMSWRLTYGTLDDQYILHECDNRRCVRPDHLFQGTQKTNIRDMMDKGRAPQMRAKLTIKDVIAIRQSASDGMSQMKIAVLFGISKTMVAHIIHRRRWKDID